MRTLSFALALAILLAETTPALAQTGLTGTWQVEGVGIGFPWKVVLRMDGTRVIGAVSSCTTRDPVQIFEGKLDGSTVAFKCTIGGALRTVTFIGRINGDEIAFGWELELKNINFPANATDGMFGPSAPRIFTAKRVPDADGKVAEVADQVRRPPAVTFDRILHAGKEPQNWLTYSGNLSWPAP